MTATGLLIQGAFGANLVKNGGFEKPLAPAGNYRCFNTGQTFAGWTVVGATGSVCIVSGTYTFNGFTFQPEAGAQQLDLTGGPTWRQRIPKLCHNARRGIHVNFLGRQPCRTNARPHEHRERGGERAPTFSVTNEAGAGLTSVTWQTYTTTIGRDFFFDHHRVHERDGPNDNYNGLDGISLVAQR